MTTMISYGNDWTVFFTRPISGAIMLLAIATLVYPLLRWLLRVRRLARSSST
jgi:putative tricarboxylic transport membrane protein